MLVILSDQVCKWLVRLRFERGEGVDLIGDLLRFTHVHNTGGAFGIFRNSGVPFTFLSLLAALVLVIVIRRGRPGGESSRLALSLILGGAVGNLIDRIRLGWVTDFIDVGWGSLRWPVFNPADMAVVTGVVLYLLLSFRRAGGPDHEKTTESGDEEPLRSAGRGGPEA